jgi:hypothetical protein
MTLAEIADVLDSFNLRDVAATLREERCTDIAQLVAISNAVGAVRGYSMALRNHARALRNTAAEHERSNLAYIAGQLLGHVEELSRRVAA